MITGKLNYHPVYKTFNTLLDNFLSDNNVFNTNDFSGLVGSNVPVNIRETESSYLIDVVSPGFEKEDFKIQIDQNILTVSAEKKLAEIPDNEKQIKQEYGFRSFKRSFTLNDKVDKKNINAKYETGLLKITLLKREDIKNLPVEINIQ